MQKILLVMLFSFSASIFAAMPIFTQTYDLDEFVYCEGLYLDGMSYSFTVSGIPDMDCGAPLGGPGNTNNITFPNIEGTTSGILHLTFDVPTTKFGFGVAMSASGNFDESVTVNLFRPGAGLLRDTIFLDTTPDPNFTGGRYDYNGPAVKTVTIQFSRVGGRFALDNVYYFRPPGQM
jgi:hypothetical protein